MVSGPGSCGAAHPAVVAVLSSRSRPSVSPPLPWLFQDGVGRVAQRSRSDAFQ